MTDRFSGFLVALEKDLREDDAEATIAAIKQIRGVVNVVPLPADPTTATAVMRAKAELVQQFWQILKL